jgi:hypothetical protein
MTIKFNCPKCKSLIAFADKYAGKPARCLTCGQPFVIPAENGLTPRIIEPKTKEERPLPGFYHAVFVDSWKIFFDRDNLTALVFVTAAVCFKFFSAGTLCLGFIAYFAAWGYLFGFYLKIIYETSVVGDKLPEIEVGTSIDFLWHIIKPILLFAAILFAVEIPFYVVASLTGKSSETLESMWRRRDVVDLLLMFLFVGGLFVFPLAILKVAITEDITALLGLRRFFVPVISAFFPYLTIVGTLAGACLIETNAGQYSPVAKESALTVAGKLAVNLAGQAAAIISMRSIGLFYRHYACLFDY